MNHYFRLSDFRQMMRTSGPLFAFIIPWFVVLIGQLAALCYIIKPIYSSFYLIIIGNMFTICIMAFLFQVFFPQNLSFNKCTLNEITFTSRFKKITYGLICIYVLGQLAQMIYFKGFPLLWLILEGNSNYDKYGIKSLNGLLNAIYLLSFTSLFLINLKDKSWKKLITLVLLFFFPVLTVSRQVFLSAFLQVICCALIYNPKKVKKYFFYAIVVMSLFVILGNYRSGLGQLVKIIGPKPYIPTFLHPLLWIYAYVVTPFNNINFEIDHITPIGAPINELLPLIPTGIRTLFHFDLPETGFKLVHQNMNVSTFYIGPLLDFGRFYSFCLMVLFQFFFLLSYRKAVKTKSPIHILEYSVLYMITVLSIFNNHLFFLPIIFQLVIINLAKFKILRIKNNNVLSVGKV